MEKITQNQKVIKILCFVLALLLWIFVSYQENPSMTKTIKNVPITIAGEQALKENGLSVYSVSEKSVNVRATAKRLSLSRINNKTISASINVSSIKKPGKHVIPASVTSGISSSASYYVKGKDITVVIEPILSKKYTVEADIATPQDTSVLLKSHTLSEEKVTVYAPDSIMDAIGSIKTQQIIPDSKAKSQTVSLVVYAKNGKILEGAECNPSEITVDYTVNTIKSLPIVLKTLDGSSHKLPAEYAAEVYGSGEAFENYTEIETLMVSLNDQQPGDKVKAQLNLPEYATLHKGSGEIEIELKKEYFKED